MSISTIVTKQPDTEYPKTLYKKVLTALISQSGTAAPTLTTIQDTLNVTITKTRTGTGIYTLTSTGAFPVNKTTVQIQRVNVSGLFIEHVDADTIRITTYTFAGLAADDVLAGNTLKIEVYNI